MFVNFTGMEIYFWKSGLQNDENPKLLQEKTISLQEEKMSHKSIECKFFGEQQKKLQLEPDLLTVDLNFEGYTSILDIPIENNGVYSFMCDHITEDKKANKKQLNLVVTVKSFGTQRLIQFESSLIFSNNNEYPVTLAFCFCAGPNVVHETK